MIYPLALVLALSSCAKESESKKDPSEIKSIDEVEDISQSKEETKVIEKFDKTYYEYFDTVTTLMTYTDDGKDFERISKILEDELAKYHKLYNSYDEFEGINNFKTINDKAGIEPVKVDPEIIDLIDYSKEMYELTDGKINIAMGRVLEIWHEYRQMASKNPDNASIPTDKELEEASKHVDIDAIEVDHENMTVFIKDPDVKLDIGAVGKGFATERIAKTLKDQGFKRGILSVGGDDVIIGENPNNEDGTWKIAIVNPFLDQEDKPYSSAIDIKDTSVVTSGDYQRYFTVDGKNYHHIIDPATNYPSEKWKSVSVSTDSIALADTLSTYLFIIDYEDGLKVLEENGAEGFLIDQEGKEYRTDGWQEVEDTEILEK
ncbi:MAG: FAD:protein FMN transferase [Anaerococcus sp.]|nr:FAD:protein FMN transferase [Anaerococcus sp.]